MICAVRVKRDEVHDRIDVYEPRDNGAHWKHVARAVQAIYGPSAEER